MRDVAWCDTCQRDLRDDELNAGSTCPTCGGSIALAQAPPRIPWHFWVLVVAATIYLAWRGIEGVAWLVDWAI